LLSATGDLGVGFAWVVENFSRRAFVSLHLDLLGVLESGCVDVPFCAFEFRESFADQEVGSGCSCCGCEFPCDFPWNCRSVIFGRMVDGGGGCIFVSLADLADPLLY
jgi:hypothetical protein